MRGAILWSSLIVSLVLVGPAWGQFRTVSPSEIKYQPVDTSRAVVAPMSSQPSGSRLGSIFSMFHMPSFLKSGPRPGGPAAPITTLPTSSKNTLRPVMPISGR
jgi:hypothetical protein